MMNQFLTDQELRELTGTTRKVEQIQILRQNGISHTVRKDGKPMVTWHQVNFPNLVTVEYHGNKPDFGALLGSDAYA